MSVQSQIDRLNAIKQRIRTNLVAQGIPVPEDAKLEAMAEQILSVAGVPGTDGQPGQDGYTPVRGIDYYTEADKAEFSTYIATELAKRGQLAPEFAESLEWLEANGDKTKLYVLNDKADPNYGMIYAWKLTKTEVSGPSYTNVLHTAKDTDGTIFNGIGYKNSARWSSSSNSVTSGSATQGITGFIPCKNDDVVRVKGFAKRSSNAWYLISFDASGTKLKSFTPYNSNLEEGSVEDTAYTDPGYFAVKITSALFDNGVASVRFSIGAFSESSIITVNEEISETGGTTIVEEYKWSSTGHALIPAEYENRIIAVEERSLSNVGRISALEKAVASGGADETETAALNRIKVWDKPVYDSTPVTLIADSRVKPALTTNDRTIPAIYAKYRALMAAHPDYIKETNMGKSSASSTFTAVDMLRFDFCEPGGLTQPDMADSGRHETKPTLIFLSGIHTEWVGVWGLYYALEEIVTNHDFDDVRRNARIVVIPCANPYCLTSQTAIDGWRMSHVNANGVAIHNNFGVNHSTSGSVGEYNYGGSAPYSELETQYIDAVMAEYPNAVAFVSCHNNDYSTYYDAPVIWASSATYHMCNMAFRLIDKLTKAWLDKYGQPLKDSIDAIKINMDANDYRLGRATMSSSKGTEQLNATKYGIQGVNLEISRMMKVFSGNADGISEVMTHGAEVYANFIRTLLWNYDHKDKKEYAPNLPWK